MRCVLDAHAVPLEDFQKQDPTSETCPAVVTFVTDATDHAGRRDVHDSVAAGTLASAPTGRTVTEPRFASARAWPERCTFLGFVL